MPAYDLICFSHIPWGSDCHRLLATAAEDRQVIFVEPPLHEDGPPGREMRTEDGVTVVQQILPTGLTPAEEHEVLRALADDLVVDSGVERYVLWLSTPFALPAVHHLAPVAVVYDCADPVLAGCESLLIATADVVLEGEQTWDDVAPRLDDLVLERTGDDDGRMQWDHADLDVAISA